VDDRTLVALITLPGVVLIFAAFDAIAHHIGRFELLPGERARQFRTLALALAVAATFPFAIPLLGSQLQTTALLLTLGFVVYLIVTRRRRARLFADWPPEDRAEIERRVVIARSRRGLALLVASFASVMVWIVAVAFVMSPVNR
jgi:hypothetical protein